MPTAAAPAPHATPPRLAACRTVDRARLVVLVPAHHEQAALPGALRALRRQTARPAAVTVVADRCTDATPEVARAFGARVLRTRDNADRKAGALNQALAALAVAPPEYVLVLDADTRLAPTFVEIALAHLDSDPALGAVSGIFHGDGARGVVELCQANEYTRYASKILTTGRVAVVTGTASMFRYRALADVAEHRGDALPGTRGDVYDRRAVTEDSELTLALRTRGWRLVAPAACRCSTELMPTLPTLHRQRVRWYGGMLDNLRAYGLTPVTARYHLQQAALTLGTLTWWAMLLIMLGAAVAGTFVWQGFWLALGGVFLVERLVTVWDGGPRARWLGAAVLPELLYDTALQCAYLHAWVTHLRGRQPSWGHLAPARA
ncbi:glycosyltransferase family 2 protein [Cellulomonas sp. ACRRI]|uniref:glycosyltransferase family 2 protein n=1 Tax=Cellulomonas sp. ACRRI TaxID=2918188 RepID=UPI001EF1A138|nr:glycosyltransferase family 2 protein [Cellulomonas sp. ACRRI]MCG7287999.1 glycosyltransferase family 2 protein [Cellulomonas sp. ACRRI]